MAGAALVSAACDRPAGSCRVASVGDVEITMKDVEEMRQYYVPAPASAAATRLAVDVWLAEHVGSGEVGKLSMVERVRMHRRMVIRHGEEWPSVLEAATVSREVRHGPCYVPLGGDE